MGKGEEKKSLSPFGRETVGTYYIIVAKMLMPLAEIRQCFAQVRSRRSLSDGVTS